jgi:hypothetical protein
MRKQFENKRWGLVFAFFALISLVLLASTLKGLDFRPAQPFGRGSTIETVESAEVKQILVQVMEAPLGNQLVFWGGLFLIGLTLYLLLSPEARKQFIRRFLRMATFAVILYYVLKENPDILTGLLSGLLLLPSSLKEISEASQTAELAPPVFQPPHISPVLSYVITFGLILMAILFIWTLNRWWIKQKEIMAARPSLTKIAAIARASLKELETGRDSDDAIIQCYERMSHVVGSKQGLHRANAMTPSEFAARLERSGLPREAVSRLTHLFESIRYGGHVSGPRETTEAISCLTSILNYCGEAL